MDFEFFDTLRYPRRGYRPRQLDYQFIHLDGKIIATTYSRGRRVDLWLDADLSRRIFIPHLPCMYVIVSRYRGYVREPTLFRIKRKGHCRLRKIEMRFK